MDAEAQKNWKHYWRN